MMTATLTVDFGRYVYEAWSMAIEDSWAAEHAFASWMSPWNKGARVLYQEGRVVGAVRSITQHHYGPTVDYPRGYALIRIEMELDVDLYVGTHGPYRVGGNPAEDRWLLTPHTGGGFLVERLR